MFDTSGRFYFVDTGSGAIYYANPDGSAIDRAASGLEFPNGMGLSPDGGRLYASETYSGRLWRWRVAGPGVLTERTLLLSTEGLHGWDGLAVDGEENICAANLQLGGITVVGRDGRVRVEFAVPEPDPFVTNICFGGRDQRQAFITSSGRGKLYQADWPFPGLRLHFAR